MDRHNTRQYEDYFVIRMVCRQLDWQIDASGAAQIGRALILALSGVEAFMLQVESDFYESIMPTGWRNVEIDSATWHELLRSFVWVKELYICGALSQLEELSRALVVSNEGEFYPLPVVNESESCGLTVANW